MQDPLELRESRVMQVRLELRAFREFRAAQGRLEPKDPGYSGKYRADRSARDSRECGS